MRFGIPVFGDRTAPRCTHAEGVLLVTRKGGRIVERRRVGMEGTTWADLLTLLSSHHVDTLVCGGIDHRTRQLFESKQLAVIENVASSTEDVVAAIQHGSLRPGFGFDCGNAQGAAPPVAGTERAEHDAADPAPRAVDCLECTDQVCRRGEPCLPGATSAHRWAARSNECMLETAMDIALEPERTLCRLSEIVYFCLGMEFDRLGVAYCIELADPTATLVTVLRRFFTVIPVCCKIGGNPIGEPGEPPSAARQPRTTDDVACNPRGQAAILNDLETQLNITVGLCMGADCVFSTASHAPVSTFVVKDRSLANNPIGALYSEHYLQEAASAAFGGK